MPVLIRGTGPCAVTADTGRAGERGAVPRVDARRPGAGEVGATSATVPNSPHLTHFPVQRSDDAPHAEHSYDGLDLAIALSDSALTELDRQGAEKAQCPWDSYARVHLAWRTSRQGRRMRLGR